MLFNKTPYVLIYATLWIIILNLTISNQSLHLMLLPLIIFGNYLMFSRSKYFTSFFNISFITLLLVNIIFHILFPMVIIKRDNISFQFSSNNGKENIKYYLIPTLILLLLYVLIIPVNIIYYIKKKDFFMINILLYIICSFFLNTNN